MLLACWFIYVLGFVGIACLGLVCCLFDLIYVICDCGWWVWWLYLCCLIACCFAVIRLVRMFCCGCRDGCGLLWLLVLSCLICLWVVIWCLVSSLLLCLLAAVDFGDVMWLLLTMLADGLVGFRWLFINSVGQIVSL